MKRSGILIVLAATLLGSTPGFAQLATKGEPAAPELAPAGQVDRFVIPSYTSIASAGVQRSLTLVTVQNNSTVTCNVAVSFQFAFSTSNVCVINLAIPAKQSRLYCSRAGSGNNPPCSITCNPALTFNAGHAFVSSTTGADCNGLSADAQQWFLQGSADTAVQSVNRLSLTRVVRTIGD